MCLKLGKHHVLTVKQYNSLYSKLAMQIILAAVKKLNINNFTSIDC